MKSRDRIIDDFLLRMTRVADGVDIADRLGCCQWHDSHSGWKLVDAEAGEQGDPQSTADHVERGDVRVGFVFELHLNSSPGAGVEEDRPAWPLASIVVDPRVSLHFDQREFSACGQLVVFGYSDDVRIFKQKAAVDLRWKRWVFGFGDDDLDVGPTLMPLILSQVELNCRIRELMFEEEHQFRHPSVACGAEISDRQSVDSAVFQI